MINKSWSTHFSFNNWVVAVLQLPLLFFPGNSFILLINNVVHTLILICKFLVSVHVSNLVEYILHLRSDKFKLNENIAYKQPLQNLRLSLGIVSNNISEFQEVLVAVAGVRVYFSEQPCVACKLHWLLLTDAHLQLGSWGNLITIPCNQKYKLIN